MLNIRERAGISRLCFKTYCVSFNPLVFSEVAQYQVYNLTALKRSNTRPHDHLVTEPQKINIQDSQIKMEFPQQHTYFSHLSQKDLFPQHKPPTKIAAVVEEEVDDADDSDGQIFS